MSVVEQLLSTIFFPYLVILKAFFKWPIIRARISLLDFTKQRIKKSFPSLEYDGPSNFALHPRFFENESFIAPDIPLFFNYFGLYYRKISVYRDFGIV